MAMGMGGAGGPATKFGRGYALRWGYAPFGRGLWGLAGGAMGKTR